MIRVALVAAVLFALCACAGVDAPPPQASERQQAPPLAIVQVLRDGDRWIAEFRFARDSPVWAFSRSALQQGNPRSWRADSWTVETPGVRLARRGWYDVLEADGAVVPRVVRVRFRPYARALATSYDPALAFTDGSTALFDGQFALFPVASAQAAERLPINSAPASRTAISFRDARGGVLHGGRRLQAVTLEGAGTYVLFGPARPIVTASMAAVMDPQLPEWLREFLARFTPQVLARYAEQLGPALETRPTVMVTWAGPTPRVISMGGSVLPGLVTMTFEGEGVLRERAELRNQARWFIAHEGAHFWLGQAVRYGSSNDAWITEGGAELLAIRTVAAIDPAFDAQLELQARLDECVQLSRGRPVASAQERGEHRAYYACGTMFARIAEAAEGRTPGGDFFQFTRRLIAANRADGVLTRGEWLAELTRVSGDPSLARDIRIMIETGVPDPAAHLASLFRRAGIPHSPDAQGRLRLS